MEKDVVIVGAGIAGLATAVGLKRIGVEAILVLEKSKSLRTTGAALTLFPNAWLALHALGISQNLNTLYAPCNKGYITNFETGQIHEACFSLSDRSEALRVVHRTTLLEALAEELPADVLLFSCGITCIEAQAHGGSSIAIIHMRDGTAIETKAVIGCDGVNSVVARSLGLPAPVYSGRWAARGLAMFPQGHGLNYEFQQFVTKNKRASFVPLNDKELYWFLIHFKKVWYLIHN